MLRRQLDRIEASGRSETPRNDGGNGTPPSGISASWRASVDARLVRLDGALEGLRTAVDGTRWVVGIVAVVMIGGFGFVGFQLNRLEGRVDRIETAVAAIPARLSDEFRAMRAEMAAQTSAIASSITATRQAQPPSPQIIVVPMPQTGETSPPR
jgi:hypothetical protein